MRDYVMNEGAGGAVRLGLIVLSTDTTLEHEARSVLQGRDVNLMHSRINFVDAVTPETLRGMAGDMTRTAALLPDRLTGIAYGCTSASTVIGPGEVERLVQAAHPGVPVTNPISAVTKQKLERAKRPCNSSATAPGVVLSRAAIPSQSEIS